MLQNLPSAAILFGAFPAGHNLCPLLFHFLKTQIRLLPGETKFFMEANGMNPDQTASKDPDQTATK